MNTESESESGEGGSEMKDSFRVSRHLYALVQCGAFLLWLVVACMFLVQRERQDFWEKAQQYTCAQPLVSTTMGSYSPRFFPL